MASPRVLITDHPFGSLETEHGLLDPLGAEVTLAPATDEATLAGAARSADAILVCYAPVTRAVVDAAATAGCRIIARYGIGYDNVDVEAANEHGITVTYVPDYCLEEVADHTMALLLALARGVPEAAGVVRAGGWSVPPAPVHRIAGRRLALVGVGRIGRKVAERAAAFGYEVVGHDAPAGEWEIPGITRVATLEEAVAEADAISLHVPLTEETRHVIGPATIALMRRSPIVVNTARGPLVDLEAATRALEDGTLGGLGLDVTEPEPLPAGHPLRDHPRAIVTPHKAFYSVEAQADLQRRAVEEVVRALRGEAPHRPVPGTLVRS
jgi:D-3-phosphoglycerate dehydrogenase / 2-oxoglutarate reductase